MRRPTRLAVLAAVVCFPVAPAAGQAKTRGEPRLAPDVARALEDLKATSPTLRQAAARTLGKVERPAPEPVLGGLCAALVDSPKETRVIVLAALGELAPGLAKPLGEINAARGPDWLKRHLELPFVVRISPGQIRYSARELERFIALRVGK